MKNFAIRFLLFCFFVVTGWAGFNSLAAQTDNPGGGDDLARDPDTAVPIDGGLALLLAAGAGYGIRKYRNAQKKAGEEDSLPK